jgi:transposase
MLYRDISKLRILLFTQPIRMSLSFDGLISLVLQEYGLDPRQPCLFVFGNKGRDKVKVLYFDRSGFAIWYKRLEKEKFFWLESREGYVTLEHRQFQWLLEGIDLSAVKTHAPCDFRYYS